MFFFGIQHENNENWSHGHKTFKYKFCTRILKSPNQNAVFIRTDILIGCFSSTSTKPILESIMTARRGVQKNIP